MSLRPMLTAFFNSACFSLRRDIPNSARKFNVSRASFKESSRALSRNSMSRSANPARTPPKSSLPKLNPIILALPQPLQIFQLPLLQRALQQCEPSSHALACPSRVLLSLPSLLALVPVQAHSSFQAQLVILLGSSSQPCVALQE